MKRALHAGRVQASAAVPKGWTMASLIERMVGAATLNARTYEEVEADRSATAQAMGVVLLSSLAAGIGLGGIAAPEPGTVLAGSAAALIGWVAWAALIYLIGTRVLPEPQTRADVGELLRTTGFAAAPGVLRVLAIVPPLAPAVFAGVTLWMLAAMVVAVRQALDYTSTARAIAVCLIGLTLSLAIALVIGLFFGPELH